MAIADVERLQLRVPEKVKKVLRVLSFYKGLSVNKLVAEMLETTLPATIECALENHEINDPRWRRLLRTTLVEMQKNKEER